MVQNEYFTVTKAENPNCNTMEESCIYIDYTDNDKKKEFPILLSHMSLISS